MILFRSDLIISLVLRSTNVNMWWMMMIAWRYSMKMR
jgi:hypothetical protein